LQPAPVTGARTCDAVAVQLRDAVDPLTERLWMGMRLAVPRLVIGRIISRWSLERSMIRLGRSSNSSARCVPLGQAQEDHIAPDTSSYLTNCRSVRLRRFGMRGRDGLARQRLAARDHFGDPRVAEQEAQELAPGVATGADDARLQRAAAAST
jgi:hypothetical protein